MKKEKNFIYRNKILILLIIAILISSAYLISAFLSSQLNLSNFTTITKTGNNLVQEIFINKSTNFVLNGINNNFTLQVYKANLAITINGDNNTITVTNGNISVAINGNYNTILLLQSNATNKTINGAFNVIKTVHLASIDPFFNFTLLQSLKLENMSNQSGSDIDPPYAGWDEQLASGFTQNFSSITFNVTASAQTDSNGYGPAYLVNGLTSQGYWYQIGLIYNFAYTSDNYLPGFNGIFEVSNPNGDPILGPSELSLYGSINAGDTVQLGLAFLDGNIVMYMYDWDTNALGYTEYSDEGSSIFNGSNIPLNGFFTGLMTEWYHTNSSISLYENGVTYSSDVNHPTNAWLFADNSYVFPNQTRVDRTGHYKPAGTSLILLFNNTGESFSNSTFTTGYFNTTFTESGLPTGYLWAVKYNNTNSSSTSNSINIVTVGGPHNYQISDLSSSAGSCNITYSPGVASGNLVAGLNINITFSGDVSCPLSSSINISNTQDIPTPNPFQQMVNISNYVYNGKANRTFSNVEFLYPNGTVIPSWLENYSYSKYALWWIKIGGIASHSILSVYLNFASNDTNLLNNKTIGEAPQLSQVYGEYDNGAEVFVNYWNFAGNSLPSQIMAIYGSSTCNGVFHANGQCSNPIINNSLQFAAGKNYLVETRGSGNGDNYSLYSPNETYDMLLITNQTSSDIGFGYGISGVTNQSYDAQGSNVWGFNCAGGSDGGNICNGEVIGTMQGMYTISSGSVTNAVFTYPSVLQDILSIGTVNSTSVRGYVGYKTVANLSAGVQIALRQLIISNIANSTETKVKSYWVRTRMSPPNGIMPSVFFG